MTEEEVIREFDEWWHKEFPWAIDNHYSDDIDLAKKVWLAAWNKCQQKG